MFAVTNPYLYTTSWRKRQKCSQLIICYNHSSLRKCDVRVQKVHQHRGCFRAKRSITFSTSMLTSLWILIKAKAFNLFCPIVLRMKVLSQGRVDIDLSQVHVVTGMVPKIRIAVRILGNDNSSIQGSNSSRLAGRGSV